MTALVVDATPLTKKQAQALSAKIIEGEIVDLEFDEGFAETAEPLDARVHIPSLIGKAHRMLEAAVSNPYFNQDDAELIVEGFSKIENMIVERVNR